MHSLTACLGISLVLAWVQESWTCEKTRLDGCLLVHNTAHRLRSGWSLSRPSVLLQKHLTIYETLKRIGDAEQRKLDTWSISLTSGDPQ